MAIGTHSVVILGDGPGTETGRNLIANPSAEVNTSSWAIAGAGTVLAAAASSTPYGNNILRATLGTAGFSGAYSAPPVVGGTRYGYRVSVRTPDVVMGLFVRLQFVDAGNVVVLNVDSPDVTTPATSGFTTLSVVGTAPAAAVTVRCYVWRRAADATTGRRMFIDGALLRPLAEGETFNPAAYFDGDSPDTATTVYAWTGTAHGSASTRSSLVVADLSCLVDSVSIVHGRDDPGSQPEASAATVDFTSTPDDPLPPGVDVGASLVVETRTATGTSTRFVGRVTDLSLGWDDAGEDTPDAGVGQLVAVGPLADLGRRVVGDAPYPVELDGARVARVMTAAGAPLDPLYSDPGTVQILARDVDAKPAADVAREAAVDATGVLWQTRDGLVRYADADHRRGIPSSLTLDSCDLLVTPSWRRNIEGLVNEVSIGYGVAPDGGEQPRYVASSPTSVGKWGRYGYSVGTSLAALADAAEAGQLLLVRNADPVWVMAALPVDVAGLDPARYEALLGLDVHGLLSLTGLPSLGTAPTSAHLWVEGYHEVLAYGVHEVELTVSGYCRTAPPPRWDDVDPGWTWGGTTHSEAGRNLFVNPSLVDTSHWHMWFNNWATVAATGSVVATGGPPVGRSLPFYRMSFTAGTPPGTTIPDGIGVTNNQIGYDGILVTAGQTVAASSYARGSVAARLGVLQIRFADSAWNQVGPTVAGPITSCTAADGWVRLTVPATVVPAGAVRAVLHTVIYAEWGKPDHVVAGETWDVGAPIISYAAAPPTYFDGDSPDTSTDDYGWADTRGASPSIHSIVTTQAGLPNSLTWDGAACFGPPGPGYGRWNDQPASLRWDNVGTVTWDTYPTN